MPHRVANITKVMLCMNFWYPLVCSMHEYTVEKDHGRSGVRADPKPFHRDRRAVAWRMYRNWQFPGVGTRRNQPSCKKQSSAGVSGAGKTHEHCRRGQGSDYGRGQWLGEERKAGWRAPCDGECCFGRDQEVAFRELYARVDRGCAVPLRSRPVIARRLPSVG